MIFDPHTLLAILIGLMQEGGAGGGPQEAAAAERGLRFLMGAYTVVWVVLAAYIFSLSIRLRRVSRQMRRIKERLGLG